ncbi:Alcohol dehydrogenase GroES domain protein [Methylobacterium sp. 4-46]|uniref:zinc-dependent alcohol dehydrogenase family protein n=1 Tax=unclassified Methylobacterium TaxID=2615210 RepID=UPI000152C134|nr:MULTISPECIES: zinc-dependent alcohol dehydrogenase family protein [Methylobacterium]ACA15781.1 Alcohol dehydrogenase GroES domain protein [Methylobacterium sp. 4-46]WFT81511.1 zinc-dependent alcohol dehydrogenase family protein [Methylobacterium nodulans]
MSSPATMRAAVVESHGAPFRIATISRPEPGPGQVLVRVAASGVNPLDLKIHAGTAAHARHPLPAILGLDMAGTVEAVGPGVSGMRVGDEVYGMTGGVGGHQGSLAEYQVADANLLAPKPANLSMREAASLPLVAITAWEGLVDRARVGSGQLVLVHGGAGGVGQAAVQIARAFGAEVFATGSGVNRSVITRLGATFIDYRSETVADYVERHTAGRGFDLVYDTVGGATLDASFEAVRRFGHVVSALGWGKHALAPLSFKAGTYSGVFTLLPLLTGEGRAQHGEILRAVTQFVEAGRISPRLDAHVFEFDMIDAAYRAVATGASNGKVVVSMDRAAPLGPR